MTVASSDKYTVNEFRLMCKKDKNTESVIKRVQKRTRNTKCSKLGFFMKRINNFLVIFMFLNFSISGAKMDINPRMYTRTDIKIELSALCDKDNVVLKMEFVNLSKDTIKIPLFLFPSDDKIFYGDWFEITDDNDNSIDYNGIQTDIDYSSEKVDYLILKSKQKYVVSISCLRKYYNLMEGETYSINYLGPLGESNIVKFKIK